MSKEKYIYILLFTAIFNAVLRISPESTFTLFRLLIPFCFILIKAISKKVFVYLLKFSIIFVIIAIIQNILVKTLFFPDINLFSWTNLFSYCIHYISIFIVVALVFCIKNLNRDNYFYIIINYASRLLKLILIIYLLFLLVGYEPDSFKMFGNINDFGCILTGAVLILLINKNYRYRYFYISLILALLLYNDSKLALFGSIFEIVLYLIYKLSKKIVNIRKILLFAFLTIACVGVFVFINSTIMINGYPVKDLFLLPFEQIVNSVYFPHSSESYTYRTNCIVGITEILKKSHGFGIGPGNTSLVLMSLLPDPEGKFDGLPISSHIWWYEIMADIGWLIIIPMIVFYIKQCKEFLSFKGVEEKLFAQIYIITFPLWSMSSSGLYTEYFTIILLSLSVMLSRTDLKKMR